MKKIIFLLLLIINCSSIKFVEVNSKIKTREQYLVENTINKYNLDINLKIIKTDDTFVNLIPFAKQDKDIFIYFYGEKSNHIAGKSNNWGQYYPEFSFIALNKDILKKMSRDKQIGVISHEIGHMLGLRHFDVNKCNYMLSGEDQCASYTYEQINAPYLYTKNNLNEKDFDKYFFEKKDLLKYINRIKDGQKLTIYLIID